MTADETIIFKSYCDISCNIMNAGHNIISAPNMSRLLGWTLYRTRKAIKGLKAKGLLTSGTDAEFDHEEGITYFYRGYHITPKAKDTLIYKRILWEDCKVCFECFGGGSPYSYWGARRPRRRKSNERDFV